MRRALTHQQRRLLVVAVLWSAVAVASIVKATLRLHSQWGHAAPDWSLLAAPALWSVTSLVWFYAVVRSGSPRGKANDGVELDLTDFDTRQRHGR